MKFINNVLNGGSSMIDYLNMTIKVQKHIALIAHDVYSTSDGTTTTSVA